MLDLKNIQNAPLSCTFISYVIYKIALYSEHIRFICFLHHKLKKLLLFMSVGFGIPTSFKKLKNTNSSVFPLL